MKGLLFHENKCAVANDPITRAGGVAGIAEINATRAQAAFAGEMQKPANRPDATRLVSVQLLGLECFNNACGCLVEPPGSLVIVVVAQVRTDDDASLGSAPKRGQHFGDFFVGRVVDPRAWALSVGGAS